MNEALVKQILEFRDKRNWKQFHTGENLAKSIVLEAGELLENYQWGHEAKDLENVKDELADVLIYCIMFADVYKFDIDELIATKLQKNSHKYPVEKAYGKSDKYDKL